MTTQAERLKKLLNATGFSVHESKKTDDDGDDSDDGLDGFDVSKFYVWDNAEQIIAAGPFDSMDDATDAIENDDQEALPGKDFIDSDDEDDEEDADEAYMKGDWYAIASRDESAPTKVMSFAGGKKHVKQLCGPGFKLVDGACVKMSAQELMHRTKAAKHNAAKRHGKLNKKLSATMKKRAAAGL